ncbi:hypothetical protein HK405_011059 [Cladochytrium tenue]|nr:hypothetical protein HK405_011059 [Cladochytrium tenue]
MRTVIVFGATGEVGKRAAATAAGPLHGLDVVLAVRNPDKPVDANIAHLRRLQADLADPASVERAAAAAGAVAAFVYVVFDAADGMAGVFRALRSAGVEHVVLLSSSSITHELQLLGDGAGLADVPASEKIAYLHARAEAAALAVPGLAVTALRPGSFASNTAAAWRPQIQHYGRVALAYPDVPMAHIASADIGDVAAAALAVAHPAAGSHTVVDLVGGSKVTSREAVAIVARALGREIAVDELSEAEYVQRFSAWVPAAALQVSMKLFRLLQEGQHDFESPEYAKNVQTWAGHPAMTYADWLEANKHLFLIE